MNKWICPLLILAVISGGCSATVPPENEASLPVTAASSESAAKDKSSGTASSIDLPLSQSAQKSQSNDGNAAMLRDSFDECIKASGGITPDMQDCIETEFEYQDARLNAAYQRLHEQFSGDRRAVLESGQKQWLSERDTQCGVDAEDGGQAQRLEANDCFLEMTAKRADELETMAI